MPGVFAGFAYHGNGVAMGSHTGAILADLVQDREVGLAMSEGERTRQTEYPISTP